MQQNTSFLSDINEAGGENDNKKLKKSQNVVPVVVRQVRNHIDNNFTLFGLPCQILKLVAVVKDFDIQSTKALYTIEDHTDCIRVVWWLESENDSTDLPNIKIGNYVILYGCLKMHSREKIIVALYMEEANDCNVITTHLLDVIRIRLEAEAKSKEATFLNVRNNPCAALANSMSFMDNSNPIKEESNLSRMQMQLCSILHNLDKSSDPIGVGINEIYKCFQPNQLREMRQALQFLLEEGYAYSTFDNMHFKLTNSM